MISKNNITIRVPLIRGDIKGFIKHIIFGNHSLTLIITRDKNKEFKNRTDNKQ